MTAPAPPVDIAAAVDLARDWTGQWAGELPSVVEPNFNLDPDETATRLAHALIALADERATADLATLAHNLAIAGALYRAFDMGHARGYYVAAVIATMHSPGPAPWLPNADGRAAP